MGLGDWLYYYPHFTDDETKVQSRKVNVTELVNDNWDFIPAVWLKICAFSQSC